MAEKEVPALQRIKEMAKNATTRVEAKKNAVVAKMNADKAQAMMNRPKPRLK
ncbi:MAG: hypothetical protein HQL77_13215 [Magnetococcales bacterium]|nr:hypothetical protein [Magnetococcales bacterium]